MMKDATTVPMKFQNMKHTFGKRSLRAFRQRLHDISTLSLDTTRYGRSFRERKSNSSDVLRVVRTALSRRGI